MKLRSPLRWTLGITLVLSLVALVWDESGKPLQANPARVRVVVNPDAYFVPIAPRTGQARTTSSAIRLPASLAPPDITAPSVDLFAGSDAPTQAEPPSPTRPVPMATQTPAFLTSEPNRPPVLVARYLGRLRTPEGENLTFLQDLDQVVIAKPGLALANGYTVESMAAAASAAASSEPVAIQLVHPATGHRETLRLPMQNLP